MIIIKLINKVGEFMEKQSDSMKECLVFINNTRKGDYGNVNLESIKYARLKPKTIQVSKQYHYSIH